MNTQSNDGCMSAQALGRYGFASLGAIARCNYFCSPAGAFEFGWLALGTFNTQWDSPGNDALWGGYSLNSGEAEIPWQV